MIKGIGIDIIEVERVAKKIENSSFKHRVFSEEEIKYCDSKANKAQHYAGRFAAKEAFMKALGTGWEGKFAFAEVEVLRDEKGKPYINLIGNAAKCIEEVNISNVLLSLSHIKAMAAATVVIEII